MKLSGVAVADADVIELVRWLRHAGYWLTADRIEHGYFLEEEVTLTSVDREAIIRTLDDPPDGLAELRAVLLASTSGESARGRGSSRAAPTK
jgi:hypothetical protein